ncbi:CDP-abequose synthase [Spirochaetia bacterium]|nr:CDP-abequose synthase [Spirochaetia bacterium]
MTKSFPKIIITGATGMIGAAIVRIAASQDLEVLCIVRRNSLRTLNIQESDKIKIIYADLFEYKKLKIDGNYDVFFHLAWDKTFGENRDNTDTQLLNVQFTLDAVRLAKRSACSVFIGAGSQAEYGTVSVPLKPDTSVNPESGYGIAKYAAGKLSRLLCSQIGMRHNWARILSVFGPLDSDHTLIMYALNELKANRPVELTKCEQVWDYLYCDDIARAFIAIAKHGIDGKIYPLGCGNPKKLSDYITLLRNIAAPNGILQFGKKDYYPHQPMYLCADIKELTEDTGWKPEINFEDGIKKILEYKRAQK